MIRMTKVVQDVVVIVVIALALALTLSALTAEGACLTCNGVPCNRDMICPGMCGCSIAPGQPWGKCRPY